MAQRETLERIRNLRQMRLGQAAAEKVELPGLEGSGAEFLLLPLTEAEILEAMKAVGNSDLPDNLVGLEIADRMYNIEVLIRAIREPGDVTQRVFWTAEEFSKELTSVDIEFLIMRLAELSVEAGGIEALTDEELADLKKEVGTTKLNELSTKQAVVLRRCLSTLKELHLDNGVGSG